VPKLETVVLLGMPVPVMACPTITPVTFVTFVMIGLPEVTVPVGVTVLLAVAFADIVTVLAAIAVMVVPGVMLAPVRGCPTANPNPAVPSTPAVLCTTVMVGLPEVRMPLNVVWVGNVLLAVAFADIVILVPMAVMVVAGLAGMPTPVRGCPTASPVVLDTGVRVVLPLVRMPTNEIEPVAVAFADIVIVVPLAAAMVVLAGMAPRTCPAIAVVDVVMGCPTTNPETLDTPVMELVPAVM